MTSEKYSIYEIPEYFKPFESHTRYKGLKGGRGSGKTTTVARHFIDLAHNETARFLCCREKQISIKQSNYASLKKAAKEMGVFKYFYFKIASIVHKITGSEFIFTGLYLKSEDLKSMENIKYVWIEQAEKVSHDSLSALTPTVRTEYSEIWCTWNPRYPSDAVELLFNKYKEESVVIHINYDDNPHFPKSSEIERKLCEKYTSEEYAHIWLGAYRESNIAHVMMPYESLLICKGAAKRHNYQIQGHEYMGLDIADGGADVPAYAVRRGSYLYEAKETRDKNGYQLAKTILPIAASYPRLARCYYDVTGVGASMKAEFARAHDKKRLPFIPEAFQFGGKVFAGKTIYANRTTNSETFLRANAQGYWNLKMRVENTVRLNDGLKVDIDKCLFLSDNIQEKALQELSQIEWERDNSDKIKVIKSPEGKPSPNLADAIMMSFARDLIYGLKVY